MAEEEVLVEVEAVEAVYGQDCRVIQHFPPLLHVHIRPRTADDSSKQFVEAVLEIKAGCQYPDEPPQVGILESKGLDQKRQANLVMSIHLKAQELSSCLMLIALCEEAVEMLSNMNHPDGDCPLCLYPLVREDGEHDTEPFMKLMSCYHCFHSECVMRWWNWLLEQKQSNSGDVVEAALPASGDVENLRDESSGSCPVCRKVFHAGDIEHVHDLVQSGSTQLISEEIEAGEGRMEVLHSEAENNRRQRFEAVLKLQKENGGLIEPKKINVLLPGMLLPEPPAPPPPPPTETNPEKRDEGPPSGPSLETGNPATTTRPTTSNNTGNRRMKSRASFLRNEVSKSSRRNWIKKQCSPP
ncbi:hypothetical protein H6P81_005059 [Aristolochia fimbriata]|uniref:E3 ubiquitin-protein ligase RNF25 n=1 Tax=Aristolochia fimbriata TaxID=158543 RepID=A0AAV7EVN2_ARIFI|nr:hypothetical protein H6P81_005059 [Aristolochia fimbriata]